MRYRPEIDGLRALAVISVILFHAGFSLFSGGFVGVDIFFVISGYLITSIILSEMDGQDFSIVRFYERRARRILPALFFMMIVAVPVAYFILLPSYLIDFGKSLIAIPLFISNILFWSERGYFGVSTDLKPLVHTWSLAVEEQFYLIYPLVLMLALRFFRKFIPLIFFMGIVLSLVCSWYLTRLHFETAFYLPFARGWELLIGASAVLLGHKFPQGFGRWEKFFSVIGVLLIGYSVFFYDSKTLFPGIAAVVPVAGTFLFIMSGDKDNFVYKIVASKPVVFVGLMSYSLYLWHQPVFVFARHLEVDAKYLYASLALAVFCSVVSYKFVEKPFRKRDRFTRREIFSSSLFMSVLFITLGATLVYNNGFMNRFGQADIKLLNQFAEVDGYNQKRFDALSLKSYDGTKRKKVLLVGDSYAKDFLNIMYEGGFDKDFQFSTKQINAECGNLYVDADLSQFIPPDRQERCKVLGRYEIETVRNRAKESDEIWLVNSWTSWVVTYLPATIQRLQSEFGAKVRVFGVKNFGDVSQKKMLAIREDNRIQYKQSVSNDSLDINKTMRELLPKESFVDILDLFCGGVSSECSSFTPEGYLISSDGGHLTKEGALYLSSKIRPFLYN